MIVFIKNSEEILKYEVVYNKEELTKLKYEIINKCSTIKHMDYKNTNGPLYVKFDDNFRIRNFKEIKVGKIEYNDFYSEKKDLYRFIYDEYKFPYLVEIINKLLDDNIVGLDELMKNVNNKSKCLIDKKIERLCSKIDKISIDNIPDKVEKLKDLEVLLNEKKLNEDQEDIDKYYVKVKESLNFCLIDKINISEIDRITSFFCKDININYLDAKQYKKIIDNS